MQNRIEWKLHKKARRQKGVTLTEAMLALAVSGALAAAVTGVYRTSMEGLAGDDLGNSTVRLIADLQGVFGANGGYTAVSATNISSAGLTPAGWRWDGTNLIDSRGNTVAVSSVAGGFALVFNSLTPKTCTLAAIKMEGAAYSIRVGTSADAAAGVISGGVAYKDTSGELSAANLAAGCGQANRKLSVQVR